MSQFLILTGDQARRAACNYINAAPLGYAVTIAEPKKKRIQEERYHAMIGDIAKQKGGHSFEIWKRLLCASYVRVARENAMAEGRPDPFKGKGMVIPNLECDGFIQISVATSDFTVRQASEFIEYLFAFGAAQTPSIIWTDEMEIPEHV